MTTDTESGSIACTSYEAVLEDYLEGKLSAADAKVCGAALADCAACRGALEQAEGERPAASLAGPSNGPGPAFARMVMARIRAAEQQIGRTRRFLAAVRAFGWRFAATATIALDRARDVRRGLGASLATQCRRPHVLLAVTDIFAPDPANLRQTGTKF